MNIFFLDLITVAVLNAMVFSLQIFLPFSLEASHIIYLLSCDLGPPFVDCPVHHLSAFPIRHLLKPLVSCSGQGSTDQGFSQHKCSQEVRWDALNVGVATIPPIMSGLTPSPKLFLNRWTSSGNVPLIWPYCLSVWPPRHDNGLLHHGYDMWHRYFI